MGHRPSVRIRRLLACLIAAGLGAAFVTLPNTGVVGAAQSQLVPSPSSSRRTRTGRPTCTSWRGTTSTATSSRPASTSTASSPAAPPGWRRRCKDKQAQYGDNEITVFAGDNIGASPLVDGLFFGEPATIVANLMNVDFASVGNHEFDKGKDELLRIQNGGCRADVGCTAAPYALANGSTTNTLPRRRLPVPVGQRRASTTPARRCSRRTARSGSRATAARSSRSASSARSSRRRRRS